MKFKTLGWRYCFGQTRGLFELLESKRGINIDKVCETEENPTINYGGKNQSVIIAAFQPTEFL